MKDSFIFDTKKTYSIQDVTEQDPLFIDRLIKEELIVDEWNETPYFHAYNYAEINEDTGNIINSTVEVDLKLEEKYRIQIGSIKSISKASYRHLIRLYCQECKSNSYQDLPNDFTKNFTCEKTNCKIPLSFQCITCENCYKHLSSAYRHVKYSCKGLKNVIKTEIKTENNSSNTKVYNPYGRKKIQPIIGTEKKNESSLKCSKCHRIYKTTKSFHAHKSYCCVKPNIKCEFCSFKSKYRWSVKQHVENMHIKKEKIHQSGFNAAKPRVKHVNHVKKRKRVQKSRNKIGVSKWFNCEHCNYEAYRKDQLMIHLQRNHSEIYPLNLFTCKLCNKNCRDMYSFNSHMKSKCIRRNVRVILNDLKV